jgi:DNA polymerase III epsilon subunit family exonuclease
MYFSESIINILDKPLNEIEYVVFDLETTGTSVLNGDEIIEIGAVRIRNNFNIDRKNIFQRLVKPSTDISEKSKRIHGISFEQLSSSKDICEVLYDFIEYSSGAVLVAHDAPKDMLFIKSALREYGMSNPFELIVDTLKMSKKTNIYNKSHSLDTLIEQFKINPNLGYKRHRALYDAEATAVLFVNIIKKIQAEYCFTLIELLEYLKK